MSNYYGSICLSDIPKELIKRVTCRDGQVRAYLNISIVERKTPSQYGNTHVVSCAPRKEERKDGVNYFIGDVRPFGDRTDAAPAPSPSPVVPEKKEEDDLPF